MSKYDWSMVAAVVVLLGVAFLMGCRPWAVARQLGARIDFSRIPERGNYLRIPRQENPPRS